MKKIYLLLLPVLFLWGSCSMDDVLESNGELNLTVIETNNPIKAEPGETVVFQFVASTSKGELSRIEITSEDGIRPIVEDVTFAMVDEDKALSLDSEGYFSREISTVLVKYPLIMPDDESLRGKSLGIKLKVTRNDGTTKVLDQKFEMIRYINNRYGITMTGKNVASETEDIMHGLGYTDYKASEMNTTKFMGGITLNFMLITEKELSGLVISDGVDKLTMANNATCGFVTESGRKGFAKHLYKNPSRVFLTKMQIGNNE